MNIIKINKVSKFYKKSKILDSISFNIKEGEIFGLIGPNGSGKTTLISILTTQLFPTKGEVQIKNYNLKKQSKEIRKIIGVVFQECILDEDLTVYDNLNINALLYGFDKKTRKKLIESVMKLLDIEEEKNKKARFLSGGMKKRLEIARGLLNNPKILFLDEPTLGLDPLVKRNLWKYIKKINKEKKVTVIIATNNMEEAEQLCGKIAVIHKGKLICVNKIDNLSKDKLEDKFINLLKNE